MSAKLFNIDSTTFVPASDFRAQQSNESLWVGSQSYTVARSAFDYFAGDIKLIVGTLATTLDPNLPKFWEFMRVSSIEAEHVVGGFATVRVNFTGYYSLNQASDPENGAPTTYVLSGTLEETPLMEHPKVVALASVERGTLSAIVNGDMTWDIPTQKTGSVDSDTGAFSAWLTQSITSSDGKLFADLIALGETTYKRGTYTWTETYESEDKLPDVDLSNLGKIDTPSGDPPTANGGRDWMLISADQNQSSATDPVFNIQRTWLLSDRGGWNTTLYS